MMKKVFYTSIFIASVLLCFTIARAWQTNEIPLYSSGQDFVGSGIIAASGNLALNYTVNNNVSRSLNSPFQITGNTRGAFVSYSVNIAATLSLVSGQSGTVTLLISPDNVTYYEVGETTNGNTGSLTIGLNLTQTASGTVNGYVPFGWYVKLLTTNNTGTPTFTYKSGQEALQ